MSVLDSFDKLSCRDISHKCKAEPFRKSLNITADLLIETFGFNTI